MLTMAPGVPRDPPADDVLHQHHRRAHVHRERRVEVLDGDVERVLIGLQAGVVHQHVQPAQQVDGRRHDRRAPGRGRRDRRCARRGDPRGDGRRASARAPHRARRSPAPARLRRGRRPRSRARSRGSPPSRSLVALRTASRASSWSRCAMVTPDRRRRRRCDRGCVERVLVQLDPEARAVRTREPSRPDPCGSGSGPRAPTAPTGTACSKYVVRPKASATWRFAAWITVWP